MAARLEPGLVAGVAGWPTVPGLVAAAVGWPPARGQVAGRVVSDPAEGRDRPWSEWVVAPGVG